MGERRYRPHAFLNAALDVVSFTPRPPYPQGNNPRYPMERRLRGESQAGRGGE